MTTAILAIDPGKVKLGVCIGVVPGNRPALIQTFTYSKRATPRDEGYLLASRVADELVSRGLADTARSLRVGGADHLVICIERMQIDGRSAGKEDNLLDVGLTASAIAAVATRELGFTSVDIWSPCPREWKGQLSKEISHERTIRDLDYPGISRLGHDALDAAAIWLWCQRQLATPLPFRRKDEARAR